MKLRLLLLSAALSTAFTATHARADETCYELTTPIFHEAKTIEYYKCFNVNDFGNCIHNFSICCLPSCVIEIACKAYEIIAPWTEKDKCDLDPEEALAYWWRGEVKRVSPSFVKPYADLLRVGAIPIPNDVRQAIKGLRSSPLTDGLYWPSDVTIDTARIISADTVAARLVLGELKGKRGVTFNDVIVLKKGLFEAITSGNVPTIQEFECNTYDQWDYEGSFLVLVHELIHSEQWAKRGATVADLTYLVDSDKLEDQATDVELAFIKNAEAHRRTCGEEPELDLDLGLRRSPMSDSYQGALPAVYGRTFVKINDRAEIRSERHEDCAETPFLCNAPVESGASGSVAVFSDASVGTVTSGQAIELRDRASVELYAVAGSSITASQYAHVGHGVYAGRRVTPRTLSNYQPPEGLPWQGDVHATWRVTELTPQSRYGTLTVQASGQWGSGSQGVRLNSGVYRFDRFITEPNAEVRVDTSAGPVRVYVDGEFIHKGRIIGDPSRILIFTNSPSTIIEGPMSGTFVAPRGFVSVQSAATVAGFYGAVYADKVEIHQDTKLVFYPFTGSWQP
jgi:hypothetical protein